MNSVTINNRADLYQIEEQVYGLGTDRDPLDLLQLFGFDFQRATKFVVDNIEVGPILYRGEPLKPDNWILGHLASCYTSVIDTHLKNLNVCVTADSRSGLAAFVKSNFDESDISVCQLISQYQRRTYDTKALIQVLSSLNEASVDNIWDKLSAAEFKPD